ncbi:agamous-like MADS-box protein AGL61 [Punica granatum]|nr:agamous-like MADS-box protein AGL61 [Punica granatum]PKI76929.1 hypothetical protein CRG98_002716 [Punica granatum]
MASTSKQTQGRQKIEMKKIEDDDDRLVTFSKRRYGIYKKASELVTMCGAEVGMVIFSTSGRPFSFGHPLMESIINKFLKRNVGLSTDKRLQAILDARRRMRIDQHNDSYNELLEQLDAEKDRGLALKQITRATKEGNPKNWELGWWERPLDELTLPELVKVASAMEAFHKDLCSYLNHSNDLAAPATDIPWLTIQRI